MKGEKEENIRCEEQDVGRKTHNTRELPTTNFYLDELHFLNVQSYLSLVNGDGPTNAAGLPTDLIAFTVHLGYITRGVTIYFTVV